ncbi:hypothetical protein [Subtercola vilae]|uniref:hypothetical protein n=1 Tax=Subtercola vilae TaxID=2056433 RepID=UPI0010AA600D|nr:hypothetical protein [Subtercola vilae]
MDNSVSGIRWAHDGGMSRRTPLPPELGMPFSRVDARAAGGRLRAADLHRPFHAVRAIEAPHTVQQFCAAYAPRLPPGQMFSHTTAALLWNLPIESARASPAGIHVSVFSPGWPPRTVGVTGHRLDDNRVSVELRHGFPVTDIASTWCHLASLVSLDELVVAGDAAVLVPVHPGRGDRRPHASIELLRDRLYDYRGRGKCRLQEALDLVRVGAESPRETSLRLLLVRAGLPEPELNVDRFDDDGTFIGRADLFYRQWMVVVDYDGDQHRTASGPAPGPNEQ